VSRAAVAAAIAHIPELAARLVSLERLQEARGRRSTGVAALDELLVGGWPRAALSEITGRRSSGRTAIVLATLAHAIAAGEATALVDAGGGGGGGGGSLDARAAAAAGLALPALLWIRCAPAQALKATDLVVGAGGFGVVALDLCDWADARRRVPDAAWVRLRHGARNQGTTVLVATGARTLGTAAAAVIELGGVAPAFLTDGPPLFAGVKARAARVRGGPRDPAASAREEAACVSLAFTCRS
jgi:RecA/RadA recombinase